MRVDTVARRDVADALTPTPASSVLSPRFRLWLLVAGSALCGLVFGYGQSAPIDDVQLATLIKFMAVIKFAIATFAALLIDWRLKSPISANFALFYALAATAMAAAPGLVWFRSDIILASVLFHSGLIAALMLSLRDDRWPKRGDT